MMTVGNVLDHKHAGHAAHYSANPNPNQGQAPRLNLTSGLEYQAWELLEAGREIESQNLVRRLLLLERGKAAVPGPTDAALLLAVERNIRNVLVELDKVTALNKFKVAEAVTEFLWQAMESPQ